MMRRYTCVMTAVFKLADITAAGFFFGDVYCLMMHLLIWWIAEVCVGEARVDISIC